LVPAWYLHQLSAVRSHRLQRGLLASDEAYDYPPDAHFVVHDYGYPYGYGSYAYDDGGYLVRRQVMTPYGWRPRRVQVCIANATPRLADRNVLSRHFLDWPAISS
jgi:hypothetical protein